MALILKTNGERVEVKPKNGTDFKLEELQPIVNGYIEIVQLRMSDGLILVINEEGKLENLPVNEKATQLAWQLGGIPIFQDVIVGDVLLCKDDEVR